DFDEFMLSNNDVVLRSIAEDLRNCLPIEAMLNSEHLAIQKILEQPEPTVHVDAFLYDDDIIDSLCEKGKMSRNYCVVCGSHKTAPLEFISHSFSLMELKFLYQYALPDLTGKILVDVGSRLGAVLFGVLHSDICTQTSLLQNADVVVMNNVFEYFLDRLEQARLGRNRQPLRLQIGTARVLNVMGKTDILLSQWVEEMKLDYDVYMEKDIDREALEQIHLYKIL
ncbi:hypothetical protein UY3_12173, partial [Chelonia mydas]